MKLKILYLLLINIHNSFSKLLNYEYLFNKHCNKFNCNLDNYNHRFNIFKNNLNLIEDHNKNDTLFKLELNKFSHLTKEEYKKLIGFNNINLNNNLDCEDMPKNNNTELNNDNFNWVDKNKITNVKNQLECGSCWAFSTIGAYENWYAINNNELVDFSEQELVDCDKNDNSCNGGLMINGFNYIKKNGICKYNDYPYNAKKNWSCNNKCNKYPKINGCYNVPSNNTKLLKNALLKNAISIAIEADNYYFQQYKSGIINDKLKCGDNIDHGVLLVGYGNENGQNYWLVKNSWGVDWGDNGYVKISMDDNNVCGILNMPSYPY